MMKKIIVDIISILLILLFVYTGVSKFLDYERFKLAIEQIALLKPHAAWLRWIVPATEIMIAIMLAIPKLRLKGLYASSVLMFVFTIYVAGVLKYSTKLPCSCGGVLEQMNWPTHLVFNSVFTLLALAGFLLERHFKKNKSNNLPTVAYT